MKKYFILTFFIFGFFLSSTKSQCIEIKEFKATKVMVTVDSMKMKYPFLVEVRMDTTDIQLTIDNPGEAKKITVIINNIEKCEVSDSLDYNLVFAGTIIEGDVAEGQITEQVPTTVYLKRKGVEYYLRMSIPNFNNSEFEIFMQEKKKKNEIKKK